MVIIDTPVLYQNLVENIAGGPIRKLTASGANSRMSRPNRLKTVNVRLADKFLVTI
ncbi:hypothetical protein THIOSC13_1740002 [uncultured Thiomicrorhabdus sp.]